MSSEERHVPRYVPAPQSGTWYGCSDENDLVNIDDSEMQLSREVPPGRGTTTPVSVKDGLRAAHADPEADGKQREDLGPLLSQSGSDDLVGLSSRYEFYRGMEGE